ncbi:MAG TPA: hypothetical protein VHH88_12650 [Verrucomicrobiae bacterium]|nr:hypothetical protein [Verrucomicrobiae bacterium]
METLVGLAIANQSVAIVRYIAAAAMGFEPNNRFWQSLLAKLPDAPSLPEGVMPHPTRFVSMTGFTRQGRSRVTVWIRPRRDLALIHG